MKKKVFIGFSGGVDSAVATHLLKKQGYEVTGVFMTVVKPDTYAGQCMHEELENAKKVATYLDIPLEIANLRDSFETKVENRFYKEYKSGNTPNPCVECNREIKFGELAEACFNLGAEYIATGHYAKSEEKSLLRAKDESKDQTYFLNRVRGEIIEKTMFPLGDLLKTEVREIAKDLKLPNFAKKDSQKICFLKGMDLNEQFKNHPGVTIDIDTKKEVGKHQGIHQYTIGQRGGIRIGGLDKPYFVAKKDLQTNTLYVAQGRDNLELWKKKFYVKDFNFINRENQGIIENLHGLIRYHSEGSPTKVKWEEKDGLYSGIFDFDKKQWAPSTGQSLVIYQGEECIGGGEITEILD